MNIFFSLLSGYKCLGCGAFGGLLCKQCCLHSLSKNLSYERVLGLDVYYFYKYERNVRQLIRRSKFARKEFSGISEITRYGAMIYREALYKQFSDFLCIPIPISNNRYKERGFNQADIIANEFSKILRIPVCNNLLARNISTKHQYTQSKSQRFKNLAGAFVANADIVVGKKLLLIDDVCTTGATLLEAKKVLLCAEACEVKALALARGMRNDPYESKNAIIGSL